MISVGGGVPRQVNMCIDPGVGGVWYIRRRQGHRPQPSCLQSPSSVTAYYLTPGAPLEDSGRSQDCKIQFEISEGESMLLIFHQKKRVLGFLALNPQKQPLGTPISPYRPHSRASRGRIN